ncbi:Uncharacterized alpha/beta hydrolase domain [Tropicibacter naphthalenivorans]|uniref:T6SS Phospholipase effector Tle1-like catalytic domain-containing protein n=2 Tax=Tropicibacter naphthalenivorans TaxID=441103 RepID=A0A0P1G3N8_9RHOB|nr:hypothetical protein TRN7648_00943 [Tropicibacter naphthalenivorans]SMC66028.1 Uncharacterized alpha/beta hydrolase domain [Tropicibacter naphthalenivorans]
MDHVIILDGTMSTLREGWETNAGLTYRLLKEGGRVSLYYEAGVQWSDWRDTPGVATGRGINRQIRRAYGYLASRYRPGDRIFLLGYSRGGYAVRSLAGIIDRVGLLRADCATERNIRQAYRLYQFQSGAGMDRVFHDAYCHAGVQIEMVGVWDTVKALGLRLPILWRLSEAQHGFHSHELGPSIKAGFHALALDETRNAYAPVLWSCPPGWQGHVEQVWFRGTHADVGGQLGEFQAGRPLSNIPLVWMVERLEERGVALPDGWRLRFPCDPDAPSVGLWTGIAKLFVLRRPRVVGADPSERLHDSVAVRRQITPKVAVKG